MLDNVALKDLPGNYGSDRRFAGSDLCDNQQWKVTAGASVNSLAVMIILSAAFAIQEQPDINVTADSSAPISSSAPGAEAGQSIPAPLELSCTGGGNALKSDYSSANIYGSNGASASGWGTSTRSQGFEGQVDINLFNGDDRIRLPRIAYSQVS